MSSCVTWQSICQIHIVSFASLYCWTSGCKADYVWLILSYLECRLALLFEFSFQRCISASYLIIQTLIFQEHSLQELKSVFICRLPGKNLLKTVVAIDLGMYQRQKWRSSQEYYSLGKRGKEHFVINSPLELWLNMNVIHWRIFSNYSGMCLWITENIPACPSACLQLWGKIS